MTYKEKFNSKIDLLFSSTNSAFGEPVRQFFTTWLKIKSKNTLLAYVILVGLIFTFIGTFTLSFKFLVQNSMFESQSSNGIVDKTLSSSSILPSTLTTQVSSSSTASSSSLASTSTTSSSTLDAVTEEVIESKAQIFKSNKPNINKLGIGGQPTPPGDLSMAVLENFGQVQPTAPPVLNPDFMETPTGATPKVTKRVTAEEVNAIGANFNSDGTRRAAKIYLGVFQSLTSIFGNLFDQYVFSTVDPTGFTTVDPTSGSITVEFTKVDPDTNFVKFIGKQDTNQRLTAPALQSDGYIKNANWFLYPTHRYSRIFLSFMIPILIILVIMTGIQIMTTEANSEAYSKFMDQIKRLFICAILIGFLTPLMMSFAVATTNLINKRILQHIATSNPATTDPTCQNQSTNFTCITKNISETIQKMNGGEPIKLYPNIKDPGVLDAVTPVYNVFELFAFSVETLGGLVNIIPTIILTIIIILLLVVILLQFITRYLNLYFLFILYPFATIFWYHKGTARFYPEFWKQIITILIQQPVFLICFSIFIDMTAGMDLNAGATLYKPGEILPKLLVYIVFLFFLTTGPNMIAARIFGDVFAAADNMMAARNNPFSRGLSNISNSIKGNASSKVANTSDKVGKTIQAPFKAVGKSVGGLAGDVAKPALAAGRVIAKPVKAVAKVVSSPFKAVRGGIKNTAEKMESKIHEIGGVEMPKGKTTNQAQNNSKNTVSNSKKSDQTGNSDKTNPYQQKENAQKTRSANANANTKKQSQNESDRALSPISDYNSYNHSNSKFPKKIV